MLAAVAIATAGVVPAVGSAAAASRGSHDAVNFSIGNGIPHSIYRVREGGNGTAEVTRGTHGEGPGQVDVKTYTSDRDRSADPGTDYTSTTDTLHFQTCCESDDATIPTTNDATAESPENITLKLENLTQGMVKAFPSEATMTIIDDDGTARTSFQFATQEIFENDRSAKVRVYVIRSGPLTSAATVHYVTQNGSAMAGSDFTAVEGDLHFPSGDDFDWIDVPLSNDSQDESDETFSLRLSSASSGIIGEPSETTITLHDEDGGTTADSTPPYTAFHQPLAGKTYSPREARTFIAFMQDDIAGSGMKKVDFALRMNRKDGTCRWWNGSRFRERPCKKKRWADVGRGTRTKVDVYSDTTIFTLRKELKSSKRGSGIKHYTAYCRGWDKAGNVQRKFVRGQNQNRFDVR